jgi:hypothetical protein
MTEKRYWILEDYPVHLQQFVRIVLDNEENLSDSYDSYCEEPYDVIVKMAERMCMVQQFSVGAKEKARFQGRVRGSSFKGRPDGSTEVVFVVQCPGGEHINYGVTGKFVRVIMEEIEHD